MSAAAGDAIGIADRRGRGRGHERRRGGGAGHVERRAIGRERRRGGAGRGGALDGRRRRHPLPLLRLRLLEAAQEREIDGGGEAGDRAGPGDREARGLRGEEAQIPWETAETYGPGIVAQLLKHGWPKDVLININFPDAPPDEVTEVETTFQGFRDHHIIYADKRVDPRGGQYYWLGFRGKLSNPPEGSDLRAIYEKRISVTPLHIDLTHRDTIHALKGVLGGAPPKAPT